MKSLMASLRILHEQLGSESPALFPSFSTHLAPTTPSHHPDLWPRTDRVENRTAHWTMQMDKLVNAYLLYRKLDRGDGIPSASNPLSAPSCSAPDKTASPPFALDVLDTYGTHPFPFLDYPLGLNIFQVKTIVNFALYQRKLLLTSH